MPRQPQKEEYELDLVLLDAAGAAYMPAPVEMLRLFLASAQFYGS